MGSYVTGTGQRLVGVHDPSSCEGRGCAIHHPSEHSMKDWPTNWRSDRILMERICPHGVGHPDPDHMRFAIEDSGEAGTPYEDDGTHGCDGCCTVTTSAANMEE